MDKDSKLIPVLREGVECVKMIFFRELQKLLATKFPESDKLHRNKLAGATINRYFGMLNPDPDFADFAKREAAVVDDILRTVATDLNPLRIPLTDALRIAVLCDHQEGVDNSAILVDARECGILLVDREMPMPNKFIELVRRLSNAKGLVAELTPEAEAEDENANSN